MAGRPGGRAFLDRNVQVAGAPRKLRLEPALWQALDEMCRREHLATGQVLELARASYGDRSYAGALRAFMIRYYRDAVPPLDRVA